MSKLYAADVSPGDFLALVNRYPFPPDSLLLAFSPAQFQFDRFSPDPGFLAAAGQGRIFSPALEFKWRRVGEVIRTVVLGEQETPAPESFTDYSAQLEPLVSKQHPLFLWGVRTDTTDEWIEQQVPHRFRYPVTGAKFSRGRVVLVVESWFDNAGLPRFSRYHHIKEIGGKE